SAYLPVTAGCWPSAPQALRVAVGLVAVVILASFAGIVLATPDGTGLAQPLDSAVASMVPTLWSPLLAGFIGGAAWRVALGLALYDGLCVRSRLRRRDPRWTAAMPFASVVVAEATTLIIDALVARQRPITAPGRLILSGRTFPSGPAAMATTLLVSVLMLDVARRRRADTEPNGRTVGLIAVGAMAAEPVVHSRAEKPLARNNRSIAAPMVGSSSTTRIELSTASSSVLFVRRPVGR
ncbi:MAG: hypothetical protein ABIQ39_14650, partial [Ilumatobacteraceae bacterium]